jgi:hypothetical protein
MKKRVKSITCANCHFSFKEVDNFCPSCGQENHTHKLPVRHFLLEFLESLTHFDTKVFRTFRDMIVTPGLVTKNYNNNKRAQYVPPARIYVFMSFIFFFLISVLYNDNIKKTTEQIEQDFKKTFGADTGTISFGGNAITFDSVTTTELITLEPLTNKSIDAKLKEKNVESNWFLTRLLHTLIKVKKGETDFDQIYLKFIKYLTYSLLVFMPFFALVLRIFYRKKEYYYSEFLVFSIYFHTFIFAALGVLLIINKYLGYSEALAVIFSIGMFIYLAANLHRVFAQSYLKTFVKSVIIYFIYVFSLSLVLMFLLLGSLI